MKKFNLFNLVKNVPIKSMNESEIIRTDVRLFLNRGKFNFGTRIKWPIPTLYKLTPNEKNNTQNKKQKKKKLP